MTRKKDLSKNFPRPEINGDWAIFDNITFNPFMYPNDCINSINSICKEDLSFSECLEICKNNSDKCSSGYFVEFDKNNKTYCLPLVTNKFPYSDLSLSVDNKNVFKNTENINTKYFVNNKKFPIPGERVNWVYLTDYANLKNVETNLYAQSNGMGNTLSFSKQGEFSGSCSNGFPCVNNSDCKPNFSDGKCNIGNQTQYQIIKNGINVKYGRLTNVVKNHDILALNEINTNLVINVGKNPPKMTLGLNWWLDDFSVGMEIILVDSREKVLSYGEKFYLRNSSGRYLGLRKSGGNDLVLLPYINNFDKIKNNYNITFVFVPENQAYYCENGECKSVPLKKGKINKNDKSKSTYKGHKLYTGQFCFGMCENLEKDKIKENYTQNKKLFLKEIVFIIIILTLIITLSLFIIKFPFINL